MGGICGIFGRNGAGALQGMTQALRRRGAVLYSGTLGACAMAQIGPAARSWSGDAAAGGGRLAVLFEGDILNLAQIRQALERGGERIGTAPLADTLAALYRAYGDDFPNLIDGPFALALTDGERLLLARDRCGVKPLYYSCVAGALAFGSEIKSIAREHPPAAFDTQSMREYFVFADHMLGDSTAFAGIRQVRAGHRVVAQRRNGAVHIREQELASPEGLADEPDLRDAPGDEEIAGRLFATIERNVRHFVERAERPGVLLSGGFDSSVLAALAVKHAGKRLQTYTISDDPEFPDVLAARRVAAHLGTRHHEFIVSSDAHESGWTDGIHAYEDLIYRNTIFLLAKQVAGTADLVLSGAGADYLGIPILSRGTRLQQARERWRSLEAMPGQRSSADSLLARRMASLREDETRAILAHFTTEYMPNQLFPSTERAMQYFGIEVAFPFASNLLHALSQRLPLGAREEDGVEKPLLRKALAGLDLPADIKLRATFCSKENLLQSKRNLHLSAAKADPAELDRAVPDEIKPLVRAKFQAVKLALLRRIFIEGGGELPAGIASERALQDVAGA